MRRVESSLNKRCRGVLGPSNPSIRSMPTWAWSKASGTMRSPCAMLLGKDGYAFWNLVWGSCGRGTKVLLYLLTGSLPWDEEDESLWPHLSGPGIGQKIMWKVVSVEAGGVHHCDVLVVTAECRSWGPFWTIAVCKRRRSCRTTASSGAPW